MKAPRFALALLLATTAVGCENARSKLDGTTGAATTAEQAPGVSTPAVADHSGDVETRLRRLEASYAKHAEALDFLDKVYAQQKQQQQQQAREEHDPNAMFAVDIAADVAVGKVDGPAAAPVTIIKAFDFACPYCQRTSATMDELVQEYQGKVRVVYKDLVVHPQVATDAHLATCAAAKQGKYKVYKNAVWEKGFLAYASARDASKLGKDNLLAIAKEIGLDADKLAADMDGDECKQIVQARHGRAVEVQGQRDAGVLRQRPVHRRRARQGRRSSRSSTRSSRSPRPRACPAPTTTSKVVLAKGVKQFKSAVEEARSALAQRRRRPVPGW